MRTRAGIPTSEQKGGERCAGPAWISACRFISKVHRMSAHKLKDETEGRHAKKRGKGRREVHRTSAHKLKDENEGRHAKKQGKGRREVCWACMDQRM
eukprot:1157849-Pelagomonas_calceolata.AAC.3